jgi:hypothetical protein
LLESFLILGPIFSKLGYIIQVVEAVDIGHAINEPLVSNEAAEGFVLGKWEVGSSVW